VRTTQRREDLNCMAEEAPNLLNYPGFAEPNKMRLHQYYLRKRETEQKINAFNASRAVHLRYPTGVDILGMTWGITSVTHSWNGTRKQES